MVMVCVEHTLCANASTHHIKTIERVDPWYFPFMVGSTQVMRIPNKENAK
jgi:hypothetical protein